MRCHQELPRGPSPAQQCSCPLLLPGGPHTSGGRGADPGGQLSAPSPPEPSLALALWLSLPVCQGTGKRR